MDDICCGSSYPRNATASVTAGDDRWIRYVSGPTFVVKTQLDPTSNFKPSRITDLSYDYHATTGIWLRWTMPEDVGVGDGAFGKLVLVT